MEDKLQKLLAPLHKDEQSLMRLDSIFKALGVDSIEDIERLTSFFIQGPPGLSLDEQANRAHLLYEDSAVLIHPNDVVTAIRKFAETTNGTKVINQAARPVTTPSERGEEVELGIR